jgi:hypothetical protein
MFFRRRFLLNWEYFSKGYPLLLLRGCHINLHHFRIDHKDILVPIIPSGFEFVKVLLRLGVIKGIE